MVYWKTLYKLSQLYKQNKTNKKTSVKKKKSSYNISKEKQQKRMQKIEQCTENTRHAHLIIDTHRFC